MKEKLVSIITPSYNSEKYIVETIKSVLHQTYQHWELLITDDGSTDTTVKIVEEYIKKDHRIQLFKIQNSGAAIARNNSIKNAKGDYIAFLDSDDIWLPEKLGKQMHFMHKNKIALSYTFYETINELGVDLNKLIKPPLKLTYKDNLYSNYIGCLTAMYDVSILGKVYMPVIRKRQDYALWLKILKQIPYAMGIDESLALYRVRENSMSSSKIEMLKWNWKLFYNIEKLGLLKSSFYLLCNVLKKIKR